MLLKPTDPGPKKLEALNRPFRRRRSRRLVSVSSSPWWVPGRAGPAYSVVQSRVAMFRSLFSVQPPTPQGSAGRAVLCESCSSHIEGAPRPALPTLAGGDSAGANDHTAPPDARARAAGPVHMYADRPYCCERHRTEAVYAAAMELRQKAAAGLPPASHVPQIHTAGERRFVTWC